MKKTLIGLVLLVSTTAFAEEKVNCTVSMEDQTENGAFLENQEYKNISVGEGRLGVGVLPLPETSTVNVVVGKEDGDYYIRVTTKPGYQRFFSYGSKNKAKIFIENSGEPTIANSLYQLEISCLKN